jgi:hypothetical protein
VRRIVAPPHGPHAVLWTLPLLEHVDNGPRGEKPVPAVHDLPLFLARQERRRVKADCVLRAIRPGHIRATLISSATLREYLTCRGDRSGRFTGSHSHPTITTHDQSAPGRTAISARSLAIVQSMNRGPFWAYNCADIDRQKCRSAYRNGWNRTRTTIFGRGLALAALARRRAVPARRGAVAVWREQCGPGHGENPPVWRQRGRDDWFPSQSRLKAARNVDCGAPPVSHSSEGPAEHVLI